MSEEKSLPLSPAEIAIHRAAAAKGETPSLEIVRRFIATIRKTFNSEPKSVAKGKTTRNKTPVVSEDQIDYF